MHCLLFFKELEKLIKDDFVFGLVTDLLLINKEKAEQEDEGDEKSRTMEEENEEDFKKSKEDRKDMSFNRGRRKGEELWFEMWGKELEHRFNKKEVSSIFNTFVAKSFYYPLFYMIVYYIYLIV